MSDTTDEEVADFMLTTVDNPYDPYTEFSEWLSFDTRMGYHTSSYLARIVRSSDELSETDQSLAIQQAIDDIVRENILGLYRKVSRGTVKGVTS